ncbi:DNA binding protein [Neoconidiobolus thromboides FSU 785]|nr:DNA binding protein [Neoconidiobolus thromboides FSU 785]
MSSQPSKMDGNMNFTIAYVKENVDSAANHPVQAKGTAQKVEGNGEYQAAKSKGCAKGAKDGVTGSIKYIVDFFNSNRQTQAEEKIQNF